MCTGITVTRRYVPLSRRTNIAGSNIVAHSVVTMETSSKVLRNQGDFQKNCFLRMDWRDMTLVTGDLLWCRRLVQNILAFFDNYNNNEKIN